MTQFQTSKLERLTIVGHALIICKSCMSVISAALHPQDVMLPRVHPGKVVALAFSSAEGQGSVQLRSLAHAQHRLMQFFRVTVAKKSGASSDVVSAWAEKLRVRRAELQPPCLVFLRGPGAPPVVSGCTLYFSFFTLAMTAGAI